MSNQLQFTTLEVVCLKKLVIFLCLLLTFFFWSNENRDLSRCLKKSVTDFCIFCDKCAVSPKRCWKGVPWYLNSSRVAHWPTSSLNVIFVSLTLSDRKEVQADRLDTSDTSVELRSNQWSAANNAIGSTFMTAVSCRLRVDRTVHWARGAMSTTYSKQYGEW